MKGKLLRQQAEGILRLLQAFNCLIREWKQLQQQKNNKKNEKSSSIKEHKEQCTVLLVVDRNGAALAVNFAGLLTSKYVVVQTLRNGNARPWLVSPLTRVTC